jgi:protein-S-isoprenylcysteine O-methyltransferase Ste14
MRRRLPRAVNLVAQAVVMFPALSVRAPVWLSKRGQRHGWSAGRPGPVNLVGALPLGASTALLLWAMSSHYRAARQEEIGRRHEYLLVGGPYQFSRNPMYVGEAAMWAGWAVLFGSLPVTAGLLVVTAVQNAAVRLEERTLHKRWAPYDDYRAQVPRWLTLSVAEIASSWRRASADDVAVPAAKPSVPSSADNAVSPDIGPIAPPRVKWLDRGPTTTGDVIATTSVGKPVSLTVQVTAHAWNCVLRGILAVATPGSIAGGFPSQPESAMNPARHLAESEPLRDLTAGTAEVTVSFQATEPGAYPVFYLDEVIQAAGRRLPPRTDSGGRVRYGCTPLGDIIVRSARFRRGRSVQAGRGEHPTEPPAPSR